MRKSWSVLSDVHPVPSKWCSLGGTGVVARYQPFIKARFRPSLLLLLLNTAGGTSATAAAEYPLHLYAGTSWTYDDNLFRLPEDLSGFDGRRSDSSSRTVLGVYFDKQYSRQKIFLQAKRSKVEFDYFKQLDYSGKDYLAQLNWELGNHLSGKVGGSYVETLAPYTDFRSRERNLRTHQREFSDGTWRFHPGWQLRGGATRDRFAYELLIQRINDRIETATEVGLDYLPKSGSVFGIQLRRVKGDYQRERVFSNFVLDGSFTQDELKARVDWRMTPISTVAILAGHARRQYDNANIRSVNGFNGRATVSNQVSNKLYLTAAVYREFTPVESSIVSYALSRGVNLGATWEATAKIRVDANAMTERRTYQATQLSIDPSQLKDTIRRTSLNATWAPRPTIQVNGSLVRERRVGSLFFGSGTYTANTVTLSANAKF